MNQKNYITKSLELHLFFSRIMKEHSLFLEAAFLEKEENLKNIARDFQKIFSNQLQEVIELSNQMLDDNYLSQEEYVTTSTLNAEEQTTRLTGIPIDTSITQKELNLMKGKVKINEKTLNQIKQINQRTLPFIKNLIYFKNDILNKVLSCEIYTTNYPLLITHIMNEAKMYYNLLNRIENHEPITNSDIYEQELFWNNIMKEHAEFIGGLLDPSEKKLILAADKYANEYEKIIKNYNHPMNLTNISLKETINFRDFKIAGEKGILNCQIKSQIIPLLADHIVREANHFIRLLKEFNSNKNGV